MNKLDRIDLIDESIEDIVMKGAIGCFSGDTKVRLLNGKNVSLKWLHKNYELNKFFTYSFSRKKNKVVVGGIKNPRITGRNVQLVKVVLDNGKYIKCTPDHRFLMRNGKYKEAQDLRINDSLMPLRTRIATMESERGWRLYGYRQFYDVMKGDWIYVHHMVRDYMYKRLVRRGYLVHHKDFNKLNNNPDNLRYMTFSKHNRIHEKANQGRNYDFWKDPKFYKQHSRRMIKRNLESWQDPEYREKMLKHLERARKLSSMDIYEFNLRSWKDPEYRRKMSKVRSESNKKLWRDPKYKKKTLDRLEKIRQDPLYKEWISKGYQQLGKDHPNFIPFKEFKMRYDDVVEQEVMLNNHKVKKVIWLKKKEDVYDIEVPIYHNFALRAGVFVHNSGWFARPRRKGVKPHTSATRPGGRRGRPPYRVVQPRGRTARGVKRVGITPGEKVRYIAEHATRAAGVGAARQAVEHGIRQSKYIADLEHRRRGYYELAGKPVPKRTFDKRKKLIGRNIKSTMHQAGVGAGIGAVVELVRGATGSMVDIIRRNPYLAALRIGVDPEVLTRQVDALYQGYTGKVPPKEVTGPLLARAMERRLGIAPKTGVGALALRQKRLRLKAEKEARKKKMETRAIKETKKLGEEARKERLKLIEERVKRLRLGKRLSNKKYDIVFAKSLEKQIMERPVEGLSLVREDLRGKKRKRVKKVKCPKCRKIMLKRLFVKHKCS